MRSGLRISTIAAAVTIFFAIGFPALAAPFQGKDLINVIVGFDPGAGYDMYGRFVARFLGKYLTGQPRVVVQNMPGAGSLRAANYIYNIAPKDGTTIGILGQSVPIMQLLGTPGILFDSDRFEWLGRISDIDAVLGVWSTVGVQSIEDVKHKEIAIGIGGALSGSELYPIFLNKLVGTKIKAVAGYSAREQQLAIERGELDGSFALLFSQIKMQNPFWLSDGKIKLLVQIGLQRRASMPDVPTLIELVRNEDGRAIMKIISSGDILGRSFVAPPDTDKDRLAELRQAFDDMAKDPEVIEAAAKEKLNLNHLSGPDTQLLVHQYKELSPAVAASIKQTILDSEASHR